MLAALPILVLFGLLAGLQVKPLVRHSIALAAIVGLVVVMYAYVFPGAVPHGLKLHM